MHSHVVLYKAYPGNPAAAQYIEREAIQWLSAIHGIVFFHVAKVFRTGRVVGGSEVYDVMMNIVFKSRSAYETYMTHPDHIEFAKFMLKGYMLAGSTSPDPGREFIDYILSGGEQREWIRNPAVSDEEVVWGGEVTFDAASQDVYDTHRANRQLERALPGIVQGTPFPRD